MKVGPVACSKVSWALQEQKRRGAAKLNYHWQAGKQVVSHTTGISFIDNSIIA
jgi:hypothetical protein